MTTFRLDNLNLAPGEDAVAAAAAAAEISAEQIVRCTMLRRALDARRGAAKYICSLALELAPGVRCGLDPMPESELDAFLNPAPPLPAGCMAGRKAAITGAGPAGLFAALALSEAGADVTIFERGRDVETRAKDYAEFLSTRRLNPESNLLFGEGGAGTFSDGKLYTRINDPLCRYVLKCFIDAGAPEEIRCLKRPHLGSDKLPGIVANIRRRIESRGGVFRFGCRVADVTAGGGRCTGIELASGEKISFDTVVIAHGLGGRDLTQTLLRRGLRHSLKGFQIGCRIIHPQEFIDQKQYRCAERPRGLPAAEYSLSGGGVSSFCMCPGGMVVSSSAWPDQLCSNGMSGSMREGAWANSCLICTVMPERFKDAAEAYEFLSGIERAAFAAGGGDFTMPSQSALNFLHGKTGVAEYPEATDTGVAAARLDLLLPQFLRDALRRALKEFDRKMPGFIAKGQFSGVETCVSSPVRFDCDEYGRCSLPGLVMLGEGAGRAGGIVSAAVDGLKGATGLFEEAKR